MLLGGRRAVGTGGCGVFDLDVVAVLGEERFHLLVLDRGGGHVAEQVWPDLLADLVAGVDLFLLRLEGLLLLLNLGLEALVGSDS